MVLVKMMGEQDKKKMKGEREERQTEKETEKEGERKQERGAVFTI